MRRVFLDTGGIIAYQNERDIHHQTARRIYNELEELSTIELTTTDYVFAELGNAFAKIGYRSRALSFIDNFRVDPACNFVTIDSPLFEEALALYRACDDKEWGLTDCASFVLMRRENIVEAFTTDNHFEQAGFVRLIQPAR